LAWISYGISSLGKAKGNPKHCAKIDISKINPGALSIEFSMEFLPYEIRFYTEFLPYGISGRKWKMEDRKWKTAI